MKNGHPSGKPIIFTEEDHRYTVEGKELTSATTFIGAFFDSFDADKIAPECVGKSKYEGLSAAQIKAKWVADGEQAAEWGNHVHAFCENLFLGRKLPQPIDDHEAALFDQATLAVLSLSERFVFLEAEKRIYSPKFQIAGMVDLVMLDPEVNHIIILDWKTNKKFKMDNPFQQGQHPIEHLEDCHFTKYSLQLTLYEMILRHERYYPDAAGYRSGIIHLSEDNYRYIKPKDLTAALTWMMF